MPVLSLTYVYLYTKVRAMSSTSLAPHVVGTASPEEERAVAAAIALPALVVQAKGHGHAGTAMALAPLAHVLFQSILRHDPSDPAWPGRDRFVLSAGHASLLLYSQLFLTGYGLELGDLAASRTLDARTPGHPELGHTPGVEMSAGPLGQGVASAVGIALAARRDAARHDAGADLWDPTVFALAGDGCLQEGVSGEASSLAGTLGLDNLVLLWDDNRITIDGATASSFAEDVRARYRAYGWRVLEIEDHRDVGRIADVLRAARERTGRPTFVAVRSTIAAPAPHAAGTSGAHAGPLGEDEVAAVLRALRLPENAGLADVAPPDVLAWTRRAIDRGAREHAAWDRRRAAWRSAHPDLARARDELAGAGARPTGDAAAGTSPALQAIDAVPLPEPGAAVATRKTNAAVLRALQPCGLLWGGSADLSDSTGVALPGHPVAADRPDGDVIAFGVREHAMAAILSGIALHGLWRPYGSTYLAFSDYQRPAIRLAALMRLPAVYVYTHDSVAVGEDGPTHQPVEQVASLRTVPGLAVIRPADAAEVVAAWRTIVRDPRGPVALVLTRQDVPALPPRDDLTDAVARGGYVAWQHGEGDELALLATGSEVHLAIAAAEALAEEGVSARVVSLPCQEWFAQAPDEWRERVLPAALRARVAVEAGRADAWHRWTGLDGAVVGVEEFGESGSGAQVMARRGITVDAVAAAARRVLAARR
jgi:transketolase